MTPTPILALFFAVPTVRHWIERGRYFALFGLLFSAGLGFPLPEDVPLIASGFLIFHRHMSFAIAAPLAWLGIVGGDCVLYALGYQLGEKIVSAPVIGRHITLARLRRAEQLFLKYGVIMVFLGRMFMGIRGAMVVTAGTARFNFGKFIIADGLGAVCSGGLFLWLGYWGAKYGHETENAVHAVKREMWVIALAIAVILFIIFFWRDRRGRTRHLPAILSESKSVSPSAAWRLRRPAASARWRWRRMGRRWPKRRSSMVCNTPPESFRRSINCAAGSTGTAAIYVRFTSRPAPARSPACASGSHWQRHWRS
jgi:membrane protein DedA with SNARE-associated domain